MDTSKKLHASRTINASAEDIFALLADPGRHTELDGAGMLRGPEGDAQPIAGVGQVFVMNMHQDALGDYRMINKVLVYVPGARIGWGPTLDPDTDLAKQLGEIQATGHTFTYDLAPADGGGTEVTQTYDWTGVKDPKFEEFFPIVTEDHLAGTLDNLAKAVEK